MVKFYKNGRRVDPPSGPAPREIDSGGLDARVAQAKQIGECRLRHVQSISNRSMKDSVIRAIEGGLPRSKDRAGDKG